MIIGAVVLALMAAPPPPPATQTCPDGSVILATDSCPDANFDVLTCSSTGGTKTPVSGKLYIRESSLELDLADGRSFQGGADVSDPKIWRATMWIAGEQRPAWFQINDSPDDSGVFAAQLDAVTLACKLD